jgi:hypothetical protein
MAVKLYAQTEDPEDKALVTPWTLIHFAMGVVAHGVGVYFKLDIWKAFAILMVVHFLYEVKDQTRARKSNSLPNSIADQVFAALGFLIAAMFLGRKNTPPVSILTLVAAFVIHTLVGGSSARKLHWW